MSLKHALFTESQSKVYAWIFGQPDRSYHLNELGRLTGLASASLQREINRLTEAGLVISQTVGNQRRISAYMHSPVFEELCGLIRKTMGAEPLLREALLPLSARIEVAFIYGSVARDTDTANSDVDLMVVSDAVGLGDILEQCIEIEHQLGRKINPNCYTVREFRQRLRQPDSFVRSVVAQPTIGLLGDLNAYTGTGQPAKDRPTESRKTKSN